MLTLKQEKFFNNLVETYSNYALPSYEKIANTFNYKSKNSIKQYMDVLKKEKLLIEKDGLFYISNNKPNLASSYVKAGFAAIMDDKIEKRISFDEMFNINSPSVFVFRVSGDSMVDAGIFEDDYVAVKKTTDVKIGDIVLAQIDNEFTLKTYKKDSKGYYLEPQNKSYPILRPKQSLSVFGVVVGVTRKIK